MELGPPPATNFGTSAKYFFPLYKNRTSPSGKTDYWWRLGVLHYEHLSDRWDLGFNTRILSLTKGPWKSCPSSMGWEKCKSRHIWRFRPFWPLTKVGEPPQLELQNPSDNTRFKDFKGKLCTRCLSPYEVDMVYDNGIVKLTTIDWSQISLYANGHHLTLYHKPLTRDSFVSHIVIDSHYQLLGEEELTPTPQETYFVLLIFNK